VRWATFSEFAGSYDRDHGYDCCSQRGELGGARAEKGTDRGSYRYSA
jgi:hypothetical protein